MLIRFNRFWITGLILVILSTCFVLSFNTSMFSSKEFGSTEPVPSEIETGVTNSSKILAVPYISQGATNWCFQSSLSMVMRYHGKNVNPADIAKVFRQQPDQSVSLLDLFWGWVSQYVSQWHDLTLSYDVGIWDFEHYQNSIDINEPLIISTFGIPGHTITLVGYSKEDARNYLYVHDPIGYFSNLEWNTGRVDFVKVGWEQFSKYYWFKSVLHKAQITAR